MTKKQCDFLAEPCHILCHLARYFGGTYRNTTQGHHSLKRMVPFCVPVNRRRLTSTTIQRTHNEDVGLVHLLPTKTLWRHLLFASRTLQAERGTGTKQAHLPLPDKHKVVNKHYRCWGEILTPPSTRLINMPPVPIPNSGTQE